MLCFVLAMCTAHMQQLDLSACRCLGHCQIRIRLCTVVSDLLGVVSVILCQLWQPCGVFPVKASKWEGKFAAVADSLCKLVQELHYFIMGAFEDHTAVYSTAYWGQG